MNGNNYFASIFSRVEVAAADVFEAVTETFVGSASTLRDETVHHPVELPRDLAAHAEAQTEWWYYTGHIETALGRRLGFELVFFKRRTDLDKFAVVPLRLLGNPFYFAHFALTDHRGQKFAYDHRKSANGITDEPASASESHYHVRLGDWSVREAAGSHILRATLTDGTVFEATLTPSKPVVLNGTDGVSFKDHGEASRYFAYTRMAVEGDLTRNGRTDHFTGSAWMDREFGTWQPTENQKGWDWFSIQFDNNTELMCYHLRNSLGETSPYSSGTFVDAEGNATKLTNDDFTITPLEYWKSPRTDATYPIRWRIAVPSLGIEVTVEPVLKDQELDTRGTTMIVYWEGACNVNGTAGESSVSGRAYVEMVGYDRSHDQPNLAYFLIGPAGSRLRELFG
ncbi:MAG: lipocalin family protein [Pyrinomonadaceae bacterium]|nr:lipocalin family protein [Pyrinomonadaceae bacterium]